MRQLNLTRSAVFFLILSSLTGLPTAVQPQPVSDAYQRGSQIYAAIGHPDARIGSGGGVIEVTFADGASGLNRGPVLAWVRRSAEAVTTYFGKFPVAKVGLLIVASDGNRIQGGTTFGYDGSAIRIYVGRGADENAFREDWILVHEMAHLALPQLPRSALWLQEGNATYVEPIARAQAGQLDVATVWRWTVDNMASGQPQPGDSGLDDTRNHSRIYWGGAAFWLLADVKIRERTQNRIGVQAALRAINRITGGNGSDWAVVDMLRAGDKATGGTELVDLYEKMGPQPMFTDIADLLRRLGVGEAGGQIVFDNTAPLAHIREEITDPAVRR